MFSMIHQRPMPLRSTSYDAEFSDYNSTEKIAYPPEKLPTKGEPDATDPDVGDLCYFSPWGNLCIFIKTLEIHRG